MRFHRAFLSVFVALSLWAAGTPAIDPQRYLEDVKFLASPELKGRGTGTPELDKAAAYIARAFREAGLEPLDKGSYYQAFSVTTNARLGAHNRFSYAIDGQDTSLALDREYSPFNFSSRGELSGPVVFAGYGITAPEYGYDDYAGVNVKGKVVLILRHEPQEFDDKSVFAGKIYSQHAQFFSKATNAKNHGAAAVILINDRYNHRGESDQVEPFSKTVGPSDAGIPFVQVKADAAESWFRHAGKSLEEIQSQIDKDLKPQSFEFPPSLRIKAFADLERAVKTVKNVAAYLPGVTDEYVILGAHYDHLGLGEQFSMAPSEAGKAVHPGADDNASGVAGVLALARWFSKQPKPKRGILFLTFAGEELGLLGSSHYVNHPTFPMEKAVAMINMDMIGRIRDGRVYIGGAATGSTLKALLEEITPKYDLRPEFSDAAGYGSSDHTSFTTKQVPVLFFFSGLHSDYHRPSDTWDKIDAPAAAKLLAMVGEVGERLAATGERPQFVRVREPGGAHGTAGSGSGGSGYGAYFGSVPDFGQTAKGVKFADVREGSPAARAGLKSGDVLVEFAGKPIDNLYDFTYALRAHKPGEEVPVKVLREGKPLEARVRLGNRS